MADKKRFQIVPLVESINANQRAMMDALAVALTPLKAAVMLCGSSTLSNGTVRVTVALPLASTEAVTFWPPTAKATLPPLCETLTLMVSVAVKANGLGVTEMVVNWIDAATAGGGAGGAGGTGAFTVRMAAVVVAVPRLLVKTART